MYELTLLLIECCSHLTDLLRENFPKAGLHQGFKLHGSLSKALCCWWNCVLGNDIFKTQLPSAQICLSSGSDFKMGDIHRWYWLHGSEISLEWVGLWFNMPDPFIEERWKQREKRETRWRWNICKGELPASQPLPEAERTRFPFRALLSLHTPWSLLMPQLNASPCFEASLLLVFHYLSARKPIYCLLWLSVLNLILKTAAHHYSWIFFLLVFFIAV